MNVDLVVQEGPPRYCPDCGRWLCAVNPVEGVLVVAPKCVIDLAGEGTVLVDEKGNTLGAVPTHVVEALCMKRGCRLRRWLTDKRPVRPVSKTKRRA